MQPGGGKHVSVARIEGSDLWIDGEVLDRNLCDHDAYKAYLGRPVAKKICSESRWAGTEQIRGGYNFERLDHVVDDSNCRGMQPWIQISYWADIGIEGVDFGGPVLVEVLGNLVDRISAGRTSRCENKDVFTDMLRHDAPLIIMEKDLVSLE